VGRNQETENRRRPTVTVEIRPFAVRKAHVSVGGGEDGQDQKEKHHHVTGVARFAYEGRRDR
jgi:hypothetical protein